ncbi:MAG: hypothetical protein CEN88_252 [Candidatus Berkelbacteria bacterium Licking1014_2]|uniref:HTH arsR-type domain-containing protein n=1 Tax=Candidatus Berkelbacteria bacterium Licking1014_2 TaxID=2017146 RepID=A0A554LVM9_9BACT|nr:MAG: hypothetical protein CEN88_252 [Candidatus Berkelbacteria bacterium Licking1014_2]
MDAKIAKKLERYYKGMANHHRLRILDAIANNPEITVEGLSEILEVNFKTVAQHTYKLYQSGLVDKKYQGKSVAHKLSPYGQKFLSSAKTFLHSIE